MIVIKMMNYCDQKTVFHDSLYEIHSYCQAEASTPVFLLCAVHS